MREIPMRYVKANQLGIVLFVIVSLALQQPWIAVALWAGSLCTICGLAVPTAFATLERRSAGRAAAAMFSLEAWLGLAFGLIAWFALRSVTNPPRGTRALVVVTAAAPVLSELVLGPMMAAARAANDMARFGVSDEDLAGPLTGEIVALLRFEGDRARSLLEAGLPLAKALGGRPGRSVALYARGGLAALDALERAGWDVFTGRPAPTKWTLARLAVRELFRP